MQKIIFVIVLFLGIINANSYQKVAENFLAYKSIQKSVISSSELKNSGNIVGYIFNLSDNGYIIVPTSKAFSPIKAYSFSGNFENLPKEYIEFLEKDLQDNNYIQSSKIAKKWEFIENYIQNDDLLSYTPNTYLIQTTWNQNPPYNNKLPKISGENSLAGCVQTATSQMMRYHKHPQKAKGVVVYNFNNENYKAILNKNYNWDNMPLFFDGNTPKYKIDEVANLNYDLGIANRANFGLNSTSTSTNLAVSNMIEYFGYSKNIEKMTRDLSNYSNFILKIKDEIDDERPLLIVVPGHLAIADGYNNDELGNFVHINMGWGGSADAFYNLDETIYAGGYVFTTNELTIYYNIKPCISSIGDCSLGLEDGEGQNSSLDSNIETISINGGFDSQYDKDTFEVYLKGDTTFNTSKGFLVLFDSDYNLIDTQSGTFSKTLNASKYFVKRTLINETGSIYTFSGYESYYSNYSTTITTQALTQTEKNSIDEIVEKVPTIESSFSNQFISNEKKFLINVGDENDDNITLTANSSNQNFTTSFNGNILTVNPINAIEDDATNIKVIATDNDGSSSIDFNLFFSQEPIYSGESFSFGAEFGNQNDTHTYKLLLSGDCTFDIRAIYASIEDENQNSIVSEDDNDFTRTFTDGIYTFTASLVKSNGYYYNIANYSNYSVNVSCENVNKDFCIEVVTTAYNPSTNEEQDFSTPCDVPNGWIIGNAPIIENNTSNTLKENDILFFNETNSSIKLWYMNSDFTVKSKSENINMQTGSLVVYSKFAKDMNGDGSIDLVTHNKTTGEIIVISGSTLEKTIVDTISLEWDVVGIADISQDGYSDIIIQNSSTDKVKTIELGNNFTKIEYFEHSVATGFIVKAVKDINNNGLIDIVMKESSTRKIRVIELDTDFTRTFYNFNGFPIDYKIEAIEDIDNDGVSDILYINSLGNMKLLKLDNNFNKIRVNLGNIRASYDFIDFVDLNGDNLFDILMQNPTTGQIFAYSYNESFVQSRYNLGNKGNPEWEIITTKDIDKNGTSDIIMQRTFDGFVRVFSINNSFERVSKSIGNPKDISWKIVK